MFVSPKERYLAKKELVKVHLDTVLSESFIVASDAAMLDMIARLPKAVDEFAAAANYFQIVGAREYLKTLMTIGEVPTPPDLDQTNYERHKR